MTPAARRAGGRGHFGRIRPAALQVAIEVAHLSLTPRELKVLGLICRGKSDVQIARALKLSHHTVRNHVANIYGKIGVNRRSAAVVWGRERGVATY